MLLTKDWQLKLTDFGEARAVNLNHVRSAKNDDQRNLLLLTHVYGPLLTHVRGRR